MNENDRERFGVAIGAMAVTLGQEASVDMLHGYWLALQDVSIEDVEFSVTRALRECDRLPAPVMLRELMGEVSDKDAAQIAWLDVLRAVPLGPYRSVSFEDRIINAVVRSLGGWVTFLSRFSSSDNEKWARIDFCKVYEGYRRANVDGEACDALHGLIECRVVDGSRAAARIHVVRSHQRRLGNSSGGVLNDATDQFGKLGDYLGLLELRRP